MRFALAVLYVVGSPADARRQRHAFETVECIKVRFLRSLQSYATDTYACSSKYFSTDTSYVIALHACSFGLPPPLRDQ